VLETNYTYYSYDGSITTVEVIHRRKIMKKLLAAIFSPVKNDVSLHAIRMALGRGPVQLIDARGTVLVVPPLLHGALQYLVNILSRGQSVSIVPQVKDLSCNDASQLLGCSRPFVYKLLDEEILPFHYVGSHRRIAFEDVIAYRDSLSHNRQQHVSEIAKIANKLKNRPS
jgi:excisionase family DNA binding protein